MTLAPLTLDDLTWADLLTRIRTRIPAESDGNWTLHAPVDPGITLMELFAWLLEQRLYWLDQVPDSLVRGSLRLLGLDAPSPAVAAGTVMGFRLADPVTGSPVLVPKGSVLVGRTQPDMAFTLATDVWVLPITRIGLVVDGVDRTVDLAARAGVQLLGADGHPGRAAFDLWMGPTVDSPAEARISLLLVIDVDEEVRQRLAPQWSPDAVEDVPPPAQLTWSYEGDGEMVPFDDAQVEDGTDGLRRSGVVTMPFPSGWRGTGGGTTGGGQPVARRLVLSTEAATFTAPPRLMDAAVNVGVASHCRRMRPDRALQHELDDQAGDWLPLPGQGLDLPQASGLLMDARRATRLQIRERDGRWHRWVAVDDLSFVGPEDRVFVIDREAGSLHFGDGLTGRIPVVDRSEIQAEKGRPRFVATRYQLGGGLGGNIGSRRRWGFSRFPDLGIENVVPGEGGRDPETIEDARIRAGDDLRRPTRAVTVPDYVALVRGTPGVAFRRAYVGMGHHPAYPCVRVPGAVTVYAVPFAPRHPDEPDGDIAEPQPDPGALIALRRWLDRARLIGTELFVRGPKYRSVRLRVDLSGGTPNPEALRTLLRRTLASYLDPLVGGEDGTGWPFGGAIRPSALLRRAQEAVGTGAVVEGVAIGIDGSAPTEECLDVELEEADLVTLRDVSIRGVPSAQAAEGLR